jgi:hypothetical protein
MPGKRVRVWRVRVFFVFGLHFVAVARNMI